MPDAFRTLTVRLIRPRVMNLSCSPLRDSPAIGLMTPECFHFGAHFIFSFFPKSAVVRQGLVTLGHPHFFGELLGHAW